VCCSVVVMAVLVVWQGVVVLLDHHLWSIASETNKDRNDGCCSATTVCNAYHVVVMIVIPAGWRMGARASMLFALV